MSRKERSVRLRLDTPNAEFERMRIVIDESKCTGCGRCASACAEGAIEVIDGVARLVNEAHCDGLGACIGECPAGAITLVAQNVKRTCPIWSIPVRKAGAREIESAEPGEPESETGVGHKGQSGRKVRRDSAAPNWPIKVSLVSTDAKWLQGSNLVISADCVAYACPGFHGQHLAGGRKLLVCCPKFGDRDSCVSKLAEIFRKHDISSVEVLYMNVACCSGLAVLVSQARSIAGTSVPVTAVEIGIDGSVIGERVI